MTKMTTKPTTNAINRRMAGGLLAGAVAMPTLVRAQSAQPIKLVVPFPAGGSVDAFARMTQAGLQQRLGQTVIVENRPAHPARLVPGRSPRLIRMATPGSMCSTPMR